MNKFLIVEFFVVLAIAVRSGDAIKCYVCNSGADYDNEKCKEPESFPELIRDCNALPEDVGHVHGNYTYCRKFVQDVEGDFRIVRSCATAGRVGRCIDRTGTAKIKLQYCECVNADPDQPCNRSEETSIVSHALLSFAAIVALCAAVSRS